MLLRVFCYQGENGVNEDINTTKIATTLVNCDGINTLIKASEEYTGGERRSTAGGRTCALFGMH
jgi:hypothetical protein